MPKAVFWYYVVMVLLFAVLITTCLVAIEQLMRELKGPPRSPTNHTVGQVRRIEREAARELDQLLGEYRQQAYGILKEARRAARDG